MTNPGIIRGKTTIAIPPGVTIKEQMAMRHLNAFDLAQLTGWGEVKTNNVLNGKIYITEQMADVIGFALGVGTSLTRLIVALEKKYREDKRKALEELREEGTDNDR